MNNSIVIYVEDCPPWKQIAADSGEKRRQTERKDILIKKAKEAFKQRPYEVTQVSLSIEYKRKQGKADACNIIGGIADTLQKVIYSNDKQITMVNYSEEISDKDEYWITITEA